MSGFKTSARRAVYQKRGKPFRWFIPVNVGGETRYREQLTALDGSPLSECRVVTWGNRETLEGFEGGERAQKRTMLSFIPSQVTQHKGHLTLVTDARCAIDTQNNWQRSGSFHPLPHWPCASVVSIHVEGVLLSPSTYSVTPEGIQWLAGAPAEGVRFDVRWRALPLYQWDEEERGHIQLGDTEAMPQRGQATLLNNFKPALIVN